MTDQVPDWEKLTRQLELYLRLKTFPVALKLIEDKSELDKNPWVRRPPHPLSLCQLVTIARTHDWTVGATAEELMSPGCRSIVGLEQLPEFITDGTMRSMVWVETKEDGAKCEAAIPRVPFGKYQAVLLAPVVYKPMEKPDMILIYGNPAQMCLALNALQFDHYERFDFHFSGETSCGDVIAQCFLTGKPALSIPCFGERRFGHAMDDELALALPPDDYVRMIDNLGHLFKRGIRYPIAQTGATTDVRPYLAAAYKMEDLDKGEK